MIYQPTRRAVLAGGGAVAATGIFGAGRASAASGDLSVWKFGGTPREVELWPAADQAVASANPDINVNYSYFNGQIRRQKMLAGFQTNRLADVVVDRVDRQRTSRAAADGPERRGCRPRWRTR